MLEEVEGVEGVEEVEALCHPERSEGSGCSIYLFPHDVIPSIARNPAVFN